MKESIWKKKVTDLTTGESIKYTVALLAVIYGICGAMWAIALKWADICDFFGNLKEKFLPTKEAALEEEELN